MPQRKPPMPKWASTTWPDSKFFMFMTFIAFFASKFSTNLVYWILITAYFIEQSYGICMVIKNYFIQMYQAEERIDRKYNKIFHRLLVAEICNNPTEEFVMIE